MFVFPDRYDINVSLRIGELFRESNHFKVETFDSAASLAQEYSNWSTAAAGDCGLLPVRSDIIDFFLFFLEIRVRLDPNLILVQGTV
jgi:hypothetical protein